MMNRFLTLLAIEGYTQREIARKMHCSQNTIFKRLIKIKYFSKMVVKKDLLLAYALFKDREYKQVFHCRRA